LSSSVRRGLVPLRRLGEEIALRDVHDWRALPLARVPAEAVPLVARINTLMQDVQDSVALQRRFVADAAHQLRTPVAGIRVLAQELERELVRAFPPGAATGPAGCEESPAQGAAAGWQPLLAELGTTSARMARLIGQLLSLASSETALGFDAEHKPQDIVPLLREATEPLVLQSLRAGRQIELDAPDAPVVARAHPVWLGEVMNNLLDNAQRYGGPHIVMRVAALPEGGAELTVEDDGPGVAYEDLPRLFEPFWRGAEGADRAAAGHNAAGTGLGLAIAREIVERLGGTLSAVSRPQIDGIRFTVRLAA
jgi:two-component system, OmpR family, sensor histidine kinase TctE